MWIRSTKAFNTHPHRLYLRDAMFSVNQAKARMPREIGIAKILGPDYHRLARLTGLVSVCRELGTFVKPNKSQLSRDPG